MGHRSLSPDEAALWVRVMAGVRPIARRPAEPQPVPGTSSKPEKQTAPSTRMVKAVAPTAIVPKAPAPSVLGKAARGTVRAAPAAPSNTLDGSWDRRLSRGLVSPDRTVDLHGHTLASAYDLLDAALAMAIRSGDRMILLVTGKPPRPASERPHARGAIRAATGDWLAGSRHASSIAAVRAAHPRHGGAGALYIVLKRARTTERL
ncbi:Smr/MutS family protein [Sphingomonas sp. TREG-RG-20F-R18-01]|uniref:Smr/MutS family protein n=1 Tax=Sphingomonas sp. TREG-RG-20F-R18-01 TaxID=2914982 RepID=UPI001F585515|nr:Smr/MutS family protein [Sphingomonas sp. TREG-RG-20F-R18-01]